MITFMDSKEKLKENEKCLDSQLWHACAGSMIQMPPVNSKVYYFPQGHAEHTAGNVDFRQLRVSAWVPCRVSCIKFMADVDTDEVFAKIRLVPISNNSGEFSSFDDEDNTGSGSGNGSGGGDGSVKPTSFAKTLTQSDANNGGGFSVPRYCAETIFPRLDYSADPPVQTILAKDVHGDTWKFRHIYRGTPRRHLLTTGWSTFVNHKKLVAGDSIVFLRAENGDLCVGIRRAKRGIGGGPETSLSGWNPAGGNCVVPYGGYAPLMRNGNGNGNSAVKAKVEVDAVLHAVKQAMSGQPFEVVFYPRASTPEFCVKAGLVKNAMQIRWSPGMRFKMPFETEDSSRISWFMGTISSIQVADPIRWPDSPWRLLQVTWDEPDLLQNVKRVNPWLVELVSTMPAMHMSPFSPPRKKCRPSQHPDYPMESQIPIPIPALCGPHAHLFNGPTSGPFGYHLPENLNLHHHPASMQGARHTRYGLSLSDIHLNNKLNSSFFPNPAKVNQFFNKPTGSEPISCLLTIGSSTTSTASKEPETPKKSQFVLFGQPILTEEQISQSGNASGSGSGSRETDMNLDTGHCKVFMESEDVGRTLDLSLLDSYDELCKKLANMFKLESSIKLNRVHYWDVTGTLKQIGNEPFGEFMKTARRLTILTDSRSENNVDS
ncbi:auxin response factor 18 [Artemisia annua]|uniref:Auxin response factor n=1 Tax=Artemisia annua TaxID=35608 RepID=A0A2U1LIG7_ARTAN|nr:auxin response factor 18 [Artemisia annua]